MLCPCASFISLGYDCIYTVNNFVLHYFCFDLNLAYCLTCTEVSSHVIFSFRNPTLRNLRSVPSARDTGGLEAVIPVQWGVHPSDSGGTGRLHHGGVLVWQDLLRLRKHHLASGSPAGPYDYCYYIFSKLNLAELNLT